MLEELYRGVHRPQGSIKGFGQRAGESVIFVSLCTQYNLNDSDRIITDATGR